MVASPDVKVLFWDDKNKERIIKMLFLVIQRD